MKKILVTVSGTDHPGITSKLMNIVVASGNSICDMGQALTHNLLSLSFVLEAEEEGAQEVLKELLFTTNQDNLHLDYREIDESPAPAPTAGKDKFILTCVSPKKLTAAFVRDISQVLGANDINIRRIDNLSPQKFHSLEMLTIPLRMWTSPRPKGSC